MRRQASDELETMRSQLEQERQLRAVTEACLMEDRVAWQQVTAAASETLQHCAFLTEALSSIRCVSLHAMIAITSCVVSKIST